MQAATAEQAAKRTTANAALKPLTVNHPTAQRLLGVGNTKYWELVKDGQVEVVKIGRRSMAKYASLERLVESAA